MKSLLDAQIEKPWYFFGTLIAILILVGTLAVQLQLDSSLESLIPDDGEFNSNARLLEQSFDRGDSIQIILSVDRTQERASAITTMQDPRVEEYIERLREIARESQYIKSVGELQYALENDVARVTLQANTPNTLDGNTLVREEVMELLTSIGIPIGLDVQITGIPLLIDRVSTLLITDNLLTIGLTLLFIFLFLWWYFKSLRFVFAVLLSPMISLVLLAAAMVLLEIHITISLAAVGVLVLGLGVDYSIHIAIHYQDERLAKKKHAQALREVMKELFIPITASFLTTLAGFSALLFGISPSSQDQGMTLSIAIMIIYAVSFAVFPVLLTIFAKDAKAVENKSFSRVKRGLAKLAVYQSKHPKTVLLIFGIITLVLFAGLFRVEISTSNSNWIPDSDPLSIAARQNSYAFGERDSVILILQSEQGDLRSRAVAQDVQTLVSDIRQIPGVDNVFHPYEGLTLDDASIIETIDAVPQLREQFNRDHTISTIVIQSQNLQGPDPDNGILDQLREVVDQHDIYFTEVKFFGELIRFQELGRSLGQDTGITTAIGIALVFLIASVIYASMKIGLIALIPILVGLIWSVGLMGFLGIPFTSLSTGIVSLVLGIGIDFSIHLVDSIRRYLRRVSLEKALEKTLLNSGTSILLSSVTTFIGFMALSFSQLLGTQRLGWSLGLAVMSVFIVSILTVPAIMKLQQPKVKTT